ncbi:MAG: alpha/beta fold hydrolase [Methylocystaceae bacterium]|nr:alpha/beta fold hydrolase [Methylocystaceae bacterium]
MPHWKNASFPWNPSLKNEVEALRLATTSYEDKEFSAALDVEAYTRACAFLNGVKTYHNHPYQRVVGDVATIWQDGETRLLDYGGSDDGPVVLAVPSLINKSYILDLNEDQSFMRYVAQHGLRSFLIDWGDVGTAEKTMGLEDYVMGRLNRCLDEVIKQTGRPVCLVGYCMGGVLTTALTVMEPDKVAGLVLMATPWDFHAGQGRHKQVIQAYQLQLRSIINMMGVLPIDVIQALFAAIDPYGILQKFERFSKMVPDSLEAQKFVAMEDWLNDAVPLSGPVAEECLFDWYIDNRPVSGKWEMDGHFIDPQDIICPTLLFVPEKDRIVPVESALALAPLIQNAKVEKLPAGHIGMVTGRKAKEALYLPLCKWLLSHDFSKITKMP